MGSDVSKDKELFRHLGLLSNEVIQIQKTLQSLDSHESRLRAALDELTLEKEILVEQTNRLQTLVKEASSSAVEDAEREREHQQSLESERAAVQSQMKRIEETLQTKEADLKDLEEEFSAKLEDLNQQIREKDNQLQIRNIVLTDLKAAADSLNRIVGGLSPSGESPAEWLEEGQENPTREGTEAIKEIAQRTSGEIEALKQDLREKELALAAKSAEVELTKERMGDRIKELELALNAKSKKKSPRLVSLISDMGGKRFM